MLVLNATYEPLSVVPMPRAMHLLLSNRAELIEATSAIIRSERQTFAAPSVIRLNRYVYVPHNLPMPLSRKAVLLRDAFTCQYCGAQPGREHLTLDHIIPRSRGGRMDWENVVAACAPCNRRKSNRTPDEADMKLLSAPTRPRFWAIALLSVPGNEQWRKYLYAA